MNYAILRTQKLKAPAAIWRSLKHSFREQETPNADLAKAKQNTHLKATSAAEAMANIRARIPTKHRKDAVLAIEYLVTASPEVMLGKTRKQQDAYLGDAWRWLLQRHGPENVIYGGVHRDESTPHLYAYVIPLDEATGRLNARKWLGGASALSEMQTEFAAAVGAKHGLVRGIKGSQAVHQRVQRHYAMVNRAVEQVEGLGLMDRASLGLQKPSKRAREALSAADSTLALAHEHQAQRKAVKARERALTRREVELLDRETTAAQASNAIASAHQHAAGLQHEMVQLERELDVRVAELERQLDEERARTADAQHWQDLFRKARDDALDERRALEATLGRAPGY